MQACRNAHESALPLPLPPFPFVILILIPSSSPNNNHGRREGLLLNTTHKHVSAMPRLGILTIRPVGSYRIYSTMRKVNIKIMSTNSPTFTCLIPWPGNVAGMNLSRPPPIKFLGVATRRNDRARQLRKCERRRRGRRRHQRWVGGAVTVT